MTQMSGSVPRGGYHHHLEVGIDHVNQLNSSRRAQQQLHCCFGEVAVARTPGDVRMEETANCQGLCRMAMGDGGEDSLAIN